MSTVNLQNVPGDQMVLSSQEAKPQGRQSQRAGPLAQLKLGFKGHRKRSCICWTTHVQCCSSSPTALPVRASASIPHDKSERWPWISKNRRSATRKLAVSSDTFLWVYSDILQTYTGKSCGVHSPLSQSPGDQRIDCTAGCPSIQWGSGVSTHHHSESWHSLSTLDLLIIPFPPSFQQALEENKNYWKRGRLKP